ncbi:MAG: hypothetical protein IPM92_02750 [Saprospiraceae bacterium]|nr:hypothetical protein [Saprospiraceae bacterium]
MKVKFLLMFFIAIGIQHTYGQTSSEALRYSMFRPYSTSRAIGVGNSMSALGGDFSAIAINPAGIGLYRKSDAYVSMGTIWEKNEARLNSDQHQNSIFEENTGKFSLNGLGFVGVSNPIASDWQNVNVSINLVRTADFRRDIYFKGRSRGSITDRFLELALDPLGQGLEGLHPDDLDDFEAGLAYETGALFDTGTDSLKYIYNTDFLAYPEYAVLKEQSVKQYGGMHEFTFGVGANYREWMALGLSLHIPFGFFESSTVYTESEAIKNEYLPFRSLVFENKLKTEISGVGAKMGIILKPTPFLRLGAAIQTPYLLTLKDKYHTSLEYGFVLNNRDTLFDARSPDGEFEYRLTTPWRSVFSVALIGTYGFISGEVDWINPQQAHYNLSAFSDDAGDTSFEQELNADIDKQYKSVMQYRLGAELALSKLRLRAGSQWLPQTYTNSDEQEHYYSFGGGYRGDKIYFDFAYSFGKQNQSYAPYLTGNSDFNGDGKIDAVTPLVNQNINRVEILFTIGWKI